MTPMGIITIARLMIACILTPCLDASNHCQHSHAPDCQDLHDTKMEQQVHYSNHSDQFQHISSLLRCMYYNTKKKPCQVQGYLVRPPGIEPGLTA